MREECLPIKPKTRKTAFWLEGRIPITAIVSRKIVRLHGKSLGI